MNRRKYHLSALLFLTILIMLAMTILQAASLEGELVLVEQRYESGSAGR